MSGQRYAGIQNDCLSVAELCALFSSLVEVPLREPKAVTGAVNQQDQQPVQLVGDSFTGRDDTRPCIYPGLQQGTETLHRCGTGTNRVEYYAYRLFRDQSSRP